MTILGEAGLEFGLGLLDLGGQIIADRHRVRPPPVGEVIVGVGGPAAHRGHVDGFHETVVEHALFFLAPGLDRDGRGNVAPVGDDEICHDGLLYRRFGSGRIA